jgi:serine protease inhibitor
MKSTILLLALLAAPSPCFAAETKSAAATINALGLDLYRAAPASNNGLLLSPFSIQTALAMTYAGANGATKAEMAKVLHFPANEAGLHGSFGALAAELEAIASKSMQRAATAGKYGSKIDPLQLRVANRLFGQDGYDFQTPFLTMLDRTYHAPFQALDFARNPEAARARINAWVEEQTRNKIRELVPRGGIDPITRLVLVNAIYFKAAWTNEFSKAATKSEPFFANGRTSRTVPMMHSVSSLPVKKFRGFTAVALSYDSGELYFLALVPDAKDGLPALEKALTAEVLASCATLPSQRVDLSMPRFKLKPPTLALSQALKSLGLKRAFDQPRGSADFGRMAPRRADNYLFIGEVFHKTFIAVDEEGTEAAAATAVSMAEGTAMSEPERPIVVRLDRPFFFAIQHRSSGACLFLGRITDPR